VIARRCAVVVVALVLGGCASQVGYGRATTLEPGQQQITGIGQIDLVTPKMRQDGDSFSAPWAHVGIGYRRGIAERFDAAARGWIFGLPGHLSFGAALDGKVQIVRGEPGRGLSLVSGGSIGYHQAQLGGTPWHSFTGWVPLLLGQDFGAHQFVVGPRAGLTLWTAEGQNTIRLPWFGGSTGVSFGVGSKTHIMPELIVVYSPVSFNGALESDRVGAFVTQLGLSATYSP
jgi:hypothetical protein